MKNLNEEINRMRNLISAKHGRITFISEADEKKVEDKKSEQLASKKREEEMAAKKREEEMAAKKREEEMAAKKREEEMAAKKREEEPEIKKAEEKPEKEDDIISLKDEIEKYDDDYDLDIAEELDDLLYDTLPDDEINPIKIKIMELIKSQGNYEKNS
jgi:outer membrane biosynthesis protein TonB